MFSCEPLFEAKELNLIEEKKSFAENNNNQNCERMNVINEFI